MHWFTLSKQGSIHRLSIAQGEGGREGRKETILDIKKRKKQARIYRRGKVK